MPETTSREFVPASAPENSLEATHPESGLHFSVAETIEDVTDAWHLLYRVYLRAGYIAPNPFDLHTTPQAIGPHTTVIVGRIQGLTVGTISAIGDTDLRLPLDDVYHTELEQLRNDGRKLMEVGLFGDRREDIDRSFVAVLELMRFTFWFGIHTGITDFICGIPPRRAKLYARAFGFEIIGEPTSYASVQNNPVVLLRSEATKAMANRAKHRAVDYFMEHPLGPEVFAHRFQFQEETLQESLLSRYLAMVKAHKAATVPA